MFWSETGELLTIVCDESFYVLKFDRQAYLTALESGEQIGEEGVDEAIELVTEITSSVKTAIWVGDCFIYTDSSNRLNYLVGEETYTISHFDT